MTCCSDKWQSNSKHTSYKTTPAGQNKRPPDKGKAKPQGKIKKSVAKTTPNLTTTASYFC